jgi:hypothetical protein
VAAASPEPAGRVSLSAEPIGCAGRDIWGSHPSGGRLTEDDHLSGPGSGSSLVNRRSNRAAIHAALAVRLETADNTGPASKSLL